jgi:hypothetical protein
MKTIFLTLALIVSAHAFAQEHTSDGTVMTQVSLTVAKNVCAAHADANVWIYRQPEWFQVGCARLGAVLAIDTKNPFDAMIPLMQSIRDKQAKHPKQAKP